MKLIISLLAALASSPAAAESLPSQHHTLIQASPYLRYDRFAGAIDGGRAGLSARILIGQKLALAGGLDLDGGATEDQAVFGAALLPLGLAARLGDSGYVGVLGGVGFGRDVGDTLLMIPVELRARAQLGSLRTAAWVTARLTPTNDRGDELEAALSLGWGRQHTYWGGTSAGSGPYLAIEGSRVDGANSVAVLFGLELVGAN